MAKYPVRWTFFRALNIVNISIALTIAIISVKPFVKLLNKGVFESFYILLFSSMAVIIVFAIFMLNILKSKYPSEYMSDRIERVAYFFITLVCFATTFLMLFGAMYIQTIIDSAKEGKPLGFKNLMDIIMSLMSLEGIINVIAVIFSFKLLASINKNRSLSIKEISTIGST